MMTMSKIMEMRGHDCRECRRFGGGMCYPDEKILKERKAERDQRRKQGLGRAGRGRGGVPVEDRPVCAELRNELEIQVYRTTEEVHICKEWRKRRKSRGRVTGCRCFTLKTDKDE